MKQFLIIQLILYFGWLSCIAVAQLEISGAITGSASFPHVGITCLGNLAVFITSFVRKRLDLEMGARDFLATIAGPSKFKGEYAGKLETKNENENEQKKKFTCIRKLAVFIPSFLMGRWLDLEKGACGLLTGPCRFPEKNNNELIARLIARRNFKEASVVMLSNSAGMTNSSIKQFMEYIYNAHDVQSALMKYDIKSKCGSAKKHNCNCIVIREVPRKNMPQGLEDKSEVLLPTLKCRESECHGCNRDLFQLDDLDVKFSSAVYDALDFQFTTSSENEPICICIPVTDDKWTNLLVRSLKYKDQGDRGAIVAAADALEKYLDKRGEDRAEGRTEDRDEEIDCKTVSLIVIRLVEIFVNLLLTVFFKVDGFSSALAARRAVRSYVVDSKGNGLPANVFLTSALVVVKSDSVCQVLKFRGNRTFLLMLLSTCFVNLLCAIAWAVVLIAFNGGIGKWYAVPSMAPSKPRVAVIIAAICIGIVMDCFELSKRTQKKIWRVNKNKSMILVVIVLEILFAVVSGILGLNEGIGRWVYGALQVLVWVKWAIGSCLLGVYSPEYVPRRAKRIEEHGRVVLQYSSDKWVDEGTLVYSSSFLLNVVMVGVMGDWAGIWSTWK